ncbi:aminoglycoside N(3)-acetyltransferase [Butyrivibrio sp. AE3004]|uniref:aminoglycoside N(3)-acetyltransferase n=1 Tax=Butyrivibrio sp. AE3004 TaxID=1506994 RepID=UPI000A43C760|nr:AAC(3) family N-acetyltransferase [Butyrivibrio sp. AE3004]
MKTVVIKSDIIEALHNIGLEKCDNVMVHTSLSQIGYVCGGARTVIEALIEVVGDEGTIMMPTQSWKNLDLETGVHWEVDESEWDIIRENWPAYNKEITPTNTMGAVAEMFRSWPGTIRSDHPARSVAA